MEDKIRADLYLSQKYIRRVGDLVDFIFWRFRSVDLVIVSKQNKKAIVLKVLQRMTNRTYLITRSFYNHFMLTESEQKHNYVSAFMIEVTSKMNTNRL